MKFRSGLVFQTSLLIMTAGTGIIMSLNTPQEKQEEVKARDSGKITITGTALHAKAGAVVETENGVYYIRGKQDWGKLYNKKVKVTGILETVEHKAEDLVNEKGEYSQGFSGKVRYISKAKISLVK